MYKYILCDLDGTLLDDSERHYRCYCDIIKRYGGECVSKERYWYLKRNKIKRTVLLEESKFKGEYEQYADDWMEQIESEQYLRFEILKDQVIECLELIKQLSEHLYLVTMRQQRESLIHQLEQLQIVDYFEKICSVSPLQETTKGEIVGKLEGGDILVIGDSEADQELARGKKAQFIGMTDGLRDKKYLKADYYCNNLCDLIEFLQRPQS